MTGVEAGWAAAPCAPAMAAPLRMVDSWRTERAGGTLEITARTRVRSDDPVLRGIPHWPPVLPGIFVIEALCQAMALAAPAGSCGTPVLQVVRSARYPAPMPAGEQMTLHIAASAVSDSRWDVTAEATRGDGTMTSRIRACFGPARSPAPTTGMPEPAPHPDRAWTAAEIRAVLPKRHPLLMVDQVLALEPGRRIRAIKAITSTEPCYAGVGDTAGDWCYAYPSSLAIGSFWQAAALVWMAGRRPGADGRFLMEVGIRNAVVEGTARPGDVLQHCARLDYDSADTFIASGETWSAGRRIATFGTLIGARRAVRTDPIRRVPPGRSHTVSRLESVEGS